MYFFEIVFVLLFSSCAHATDRDAAMEQRAVTYLSEFLVKEGLVKSLSREVHMYHYTGVKMEDPFTYAVSRSGDFLNSESQKDLENTANLRGFYLAPDPVSTRNYSGENEWNMLRVIFPQKTRFLDLGKSKANKIGFYEVSDALLSVLRAADCDPFHPNAPNKSPRPKDLFLKNYDQECRNIIDKALVNLGVQAIFYDFGGAQLNGCRQNRRQTAVVVIDSSVIYKANLRVFNQDTMWNENDVEHESLHWMFFTATPSDSGEQESKISANKRMNFLQDPKISNWIKHNVFACSYEYIEDYIPGERQ